VSTIGDRKVRRLFIRTFGCQMNRYDSERLVEILGEEDFQPVDDYRQADFIFINTCTVRWRGSAATAATPGSCGRDSWRQ